MEYRSAIKQALLSLVLCCVLAIIATNPSGLSEEDIYINVTSEKEDTFSEPSVLLAVIARNEEKTLPTYLALIERLQYPKERISVLVNSITACVGAQHGMSGITFVETGIDKKYDALTFMHDPRKLGLYEKDWDSCFLVWTNIQTDHNEDNTLKVLKEWKGNVRHFYHNIIISSNESETNYPDSKGPNHWSPFRFSNLMKLRQKALDEAKRQWADFIFFVDCDNFLLNPTTLRKLIAKNKAVIAPMLRVFDNESAFSNFWYGMDESGYYKRTPEYLPTLRRERKGSFEVPMIHSTLLIDLRRNVTDELRYYPPHPTYEGEWDDILIFAHSARVAGIKLHILNEDDYGRMLSSSTEEMSLEDDQITFKDAIIDWIAYNKPFPVSKNVYVPASPVDNLGFNEIYMINLARRPDRRKRMLLSLQELGLLANTQDAVDGRQLTQDKITELGITPMADFKDPYLKRPLTMGEIGCFLSHWRIWEQMEKHGLELVLVLEDDIRFEPDFKRRLKGLLDEAYKVLPQTNWDLIYIGRKRMSDIKETRVEGTSNLVWARYSYWTLGYIIRLSGARKLLAGKPFTKMIPVDEYIPVMFDDHTDIQLKEKFYPRNLVAMSAWPLLLFPTHYVGDAGYISDTEATLTIHGEVFKKPKRTENGKENIDVESPKATLEEQQTGTKPHGEL